MTKYNNQAEGVLLSASFTGYVSISCVFDVIERQHRDFKSCQNLA